MIDNYEQAMALVEEMKMHLPIPARATKQLTHTMRDKDVQFPANREVLIESIFYMGDEGGIGCGLKLSEDQDSAVVVSLTHLRVKNKHPLAKEIRAYQDARIKKLAPGGINSRPQSFGSRRRSKRR